MWKILRLFLSQKPQFEREEKIKNKNKKRTRASLFQSSEDGKQEIYFTWPKVYEDMKISFVIEQFELI